MIPLFRPSTNIARMFEKPCIPVTVVSTLNMYPENISGMRTRLPAMLTGRWALWDAGS